jgi:hypothetical protein
MLFSRILICPHFLCGQVGFGRGIKPRRYTGTLTLRFAVACLPFGSCNSGYKLHGIFNAVRPSANGRFVPPSFAGTSCPRSCHVGMNLGFWPPLHIAVDISRSLRAVKEQVLLLANVIIRQNVCRG